jgi:hypothetical protein
MQNSRLVVAIPHDNPLIGQLADIGHGRRLITDEDTYAKRRRKLSKLARTLLAERIRDLLERGDSMAAKPASAA